MCTEKFYDWRILILLLDVMIIIVPFIFLYTHPDKALIFVI